MVMQCAAWSGRPGFGSGAVAKSRAAAPGRRHTPKRHWFQLEKTAPTEFPAGKTTRFQPRLHAIPTKGQIKLD
jgi:hypothetical protein